MRQLVSWLYQPTRPRLARQWALLRALIDLCRVEWALRSRPLLIICNDWNLNLLDEVAADPLAPRSPSDSPRLSSVDAWAIRALARRWPWGGGCLRYSLVVGRRLAHRHALPGQLVLATRKLHQSVEAHAWLFHAGVRYELPARPADREFAALRRAGTT